jgi:hypothetical protein
MRSFSFRVAIDVLAFVQDSDHHLVYVPSGLGGGHDPGANTGLRKPELQANLLKWKLAVRPAEHPVPGDGGVQEPATQGSRGSVPASAVSLDGQPAAQFVCVSKYGDHEGLPLIFGGFVDNVVA